MMLRAKLRPSTSLFCILLAVSTAAAQSSSQTAPSPVQTPSISLEIKPRDIGDSRNTTYYFEIGASQGDLFVNVVTANFSGDLDFFTMTGLKPLAKITVVGGSEPWETGRVIYFRQTERVLLRVEGRTPNDDSATLKIKFAGSFAPVAAKSGVTVSDPTVRSARTGERVSSVGGVLLDDRADSGTANPNRRASDVAPRASVRIGEPSSPTAESAQVKGSGPARAPVSQAGSTDVRGEAPSRGTPASPTRDSQSGVGTGRAPVASATESGSSRDVPKDEKERGATSMPVVRGGVGSEVGGRTSPNPRAGNKTEVSPQAASRPEPAIVSDPPRADSPKDKEAEKAGATIAQSASVTLTDGTTVTFSLADIVDLRLDDGVLVITTKNRNRFRRPLSEVRELSIK